MKRLLAILQIVLLLAIVFMLYNPLAKIGLLPSLSSIFHIQQSRIDETPVIIQQVKNIAQMFTQTFYDETVYDTGIIR
ncbi:MAG: hypothetical protein NTZ12_03070, partial [Candidatus Aminicenantes bacterium]|nr:hypothetical protein [Candidatus Aminicenantes bacterium]